MDLWAHHCGKKGGPKQLSQIWATGEGCPTKAEAEALIGDIMKLDADSNGEVTFDEGAAHFEKYCSDPKNGEECQSEKFHEKIMTMIMVGHWADQEGDGNDAVSADELWALYNKHCGGK